MVSMGVVAARTGLAAWVVAVMLSGAAVTALHEVPLPVPTLQRAPIGEGFRVLHAVSADCPCSQRIMDYLSRRGAAPDVHEVVLMVGADAARSRALRDRGFTVVELDEAHLAADFGVRAVPSVVVSGPDGAIYYQGAYAPRPQMDPLDRELLAAARNGDVTPSMSLLGCAVSRSVQARLDPLRLKYRR